MRPALPLVRDARLRLLARSLVAVLASADGWREVVLGPLRLPYPSPSRGIPCTNLVPDLDRWWGTNLHLTSAIETQALALHVEPKVLQTVTAHVILSL